MPLNLMKQLTLPGLRALRGATRVEGRPGLWKIDPAELSESAWLSHAAKKAEQEAELAARPGGVPSMTGAERARVGYMLQGALGSMRQAAMLPKNKAAKGLVNVDRSGRVNAAAATDLKKAETYLADPDSLDFTATYPQYLEYVATNTPEVRGSDLMRLLQDEYGPEMVFQVYNPRKNKAIYENMGARPMPKTSEGLDILEGHEGLPAYRLNSRIPERSAEPVDDRQLSLPGLKDGGWLGALKSLPQALAAKKEAEQATNHTPGWSSNGYGDAARHAIAAGLLARRTSPEVAEIYGKLNETVYPFLTRLALSPDDPRETGMDYANESFAREIAPAFPSDEEYKAYILNWPEKRKPQNTPGALQWFGRSK